MPYNVEIATLNGDGRPDFVSPIFLWAIIRLNGSAVGILDSNSFASAWSTPSGDIASVADFNHDGRPDVVFGPQAYLSASFSILQNVTTGGVVQLVGWPPVWGQSLVKLR